VADRRFQYDLAFATLPRLQATTNAFCSSVGVGRHAYAASNEARDSASWLAANWCSALPDSASASKTGTDPVLTMMRNATTGVTTAMRLRTHVERAARTRPAAMASRIGTDSALTMMRNATTGMTTAIRIRTHVE
jgi:hypothetical protein